jgi:hypothetical protein
MHGGGMAPSGVVRVRRRKTRGRAITWDGGSVLMRLCREAVQRDRARKCWHRSSRRQNGFIYQPLPYWTGSFAKRSMYRSRLSHTSDERGQPSGCGTTTVRAA